MIEKYCTVCSQTKPIALFSRNKVMKDGWSNWCKACLKTLWQRPENIAKRKSRYSKNIVRELMIAARTRCRNEGIEFDLTVDDLVFSRKCPVLGTPMRHEVGGRKDDSPSLDRIDPTKGYVRGNVIVISWLANRVKNNCGDPEVFERIARYMRGAMVVYWHGGSLRDDGLRAAAVTIRFAPQHEALERYRVPSPLWEDGVCGE